MCHYLLFMFYAVPNDIFPVPAVKVVTLSLVPPIELFNWLVVKPDPTVTV